MKEEMAGEKMENEITKKVPKDGAKGQRTCHRAKAFIQFQGKRFSL